MPDTSEKRIIHLDIPQNERVENEESIGFRKKFELINDPVLMEQGFYIEVFTEIYHVDNFRSFLTIPQKGVCEPNYISCTYFNFHDTKRNDELSPEEQYVALKDFVTHRVNHGILRSIAETSGKKEELPFFCQCMRKETLRILTESEDDSKITNAVLSLALEVGTLNEMALEYMYGSRACPDLSERLIRVLATSENREVRSGLTVMDELPPDVIRSLLLDQDPCIRLETASNFSIPGDLLSTLVRDPSESIRIIISSLETLSEDLVRTLAADSDPYVRRAIAERGDLPEDLMRTLSTDKETFVKREIARSPRLPLELIHKLSTDGDPLVRIVVAERGDIPLDITRKLARDDQVNVRKELAYNDSLPAKIYKILKKDEYRSVRDTARLTLKRLKSTNL